MKFGGTSVGSAERMRATAEIIRQSTDDHTVVVMSAMCGATNGLIDIADNGATPDRLLERHAATVEALGLPSSVMRHIRDVLAAASTRSETIACGELFSTAIMLAYLYKQGMDAAWLPALDYMRIDPDGNPLVEDTAARARALLRQKGDHRIYITQGFIGRDGEGRTATLSRGGSDFTATLLGEALGAAEVQIWTDVDGVYTADPRIVSAARCIPTLSYSLADTAARLGAKILHPDCVRPVMRTGCRLRVLDSFHPQAPGTLIHDACDAAGFVAVACTADGATARVSIIGNRPDVSASDVSELLGGAPATAGADHITATVDAADADEAVRTIHKYFIEQRKPI